MGSFSSSLPTKCLYSILGLSPIASKIEIKSQYYKLCLLYHPDTANINNINNNVKNSNNNPNESLNNSNNINSKFRQIVEAYRILSHDQLRKQYDLSKGYQYHKSNSTIYNSTIHKYHFVQNSNTSSNYYFHRKRPRFVFNSSSHSHSSSSSNDWKDGNDNHDSLNNFSFSSFKSQSTSSSFLYNNNRKNGNVDHDKEMSRARQKMDGKDNMSRLMACIVGLTIYIIMRIYQKEE